MRWLRRNRSAWSQPWEDLEPLEWFAVLTPDVRKALSRSADWVDVAAGTRLQQQGIHARWVWVVAAGVLELRRHGHVLGLVLPGAATGEVEVLLGAPSWVDVVAASDAQMVAIPARAFHGLLDTTSFGAAVAKRMAGRYEALTADAPLVERLPATSF